MLGSGCCAVRSLSWVDIIGWLRFGKLPAALHIPSYNLRFASEELVLHVPTSQLYAILTTVASPVEASNVLALH